MDDLLNRWWQLFDQFLLNILNEQIRRILNGHQVKQRRNESINIRLYSDVFGVESLFW